MVRYRALGVINRPKARWLMLVLMLLSLAVPRFRLGLVTAPAAAHPHTGWLLTPDRPFFWPPERRRRIARAVVVFCYVHKYGNVVALVVAPGPQRVSLNKMKL